jgi:hypothetical protein
VKNHCPYHFERHEWCIACQRTPFAICPSHFEYEDWCVYCQRLNNVDDDPKPRKRPSPAVSSEPPIADGLPTWLRQWFEDRYGVASLERWLQETDPNELAQILTEDQFTDVMALRAERLAVRKRHAEHIKAHEAATDEARAQRLARLSAEERRAVDEHLQQRESKEKPR